MNAVLNSVMKKNCLAFLFVFVGVLYCNTQLIAQKNVEGKWYGIGVVSGTDNANNYLCEIVLQQNGSKVTGVFNYFFRDGYFSNKLTGTYDKQTHKISLKPIPILFHQSVNIGNAVETPMTGTFTLLTNKFEVQLNGMFESDELHKYTSPNIKVKFKKMLKDEPTLKEQVDIIRREEIAEAPVEHVIKETERKLDLREKEIVRVVDVTDDSVRVDMYDNGTLDYDTASIYYNKELVKSKELLDTKKPISFYVHVNATDSTQNDLEMFAENMGLIPPNSALMIITDKYHRYEIPLTSTYEKNAAVRLRHAPPPRMHN
jgi:hypothetical protein